MYLAHTAHDPSVNDGRPRNERPLHVLVARSSDSGRTFETTSTRRRRVRRRPTGD